MNSDKSPAPDAKITALLREARATPTPLPPRFQEGVWRRIEESEIPSAVSPSWLDALMAWALRPKFALAVAVVLICAGSFTGIRLGSQSVHQDAQNRYVASVAPNSLR